MAWTSPKTWTPETPLTASELNFQIRDNLMETAPAKATNPGTAGEWLVTSGLNQVAMRRVTRTFYTDAATPITTTSNTPAPWLLPIEMLATHGGAMLVFWSANMRSSDGGLISCGPEIVGQVSASISSAVRSQSSTLVRYGGHSLFYGLGPGSNRVRMNFWTNSSTGTTGTFNDVVLIVAAL